MNANLYPLFLNLAGRTCVVVGGSEMVEAKAGELFDASARIRLIPERCFIPLLIRVPCPQCALTSRSRSARRRSMALPGEVPSGLSRLCLGLARSTEVQGLAEPRS
jgi:hypothetical protein